MMLSPCMREAGGTARSYNANNNSLSLVFQSQYNKAPRGDKSEGILGFFWDFFLLGGLRPPRTPHRRSAPGFKDCFRKNQRFFGIY